VKAVVLAAGEGVRLSPITATRSKHLIRIGGKPLLEYSLQTLKSVGISEVTIVVHYMKDTIKKQFGDGKNVGLKLDYVEQEAVLGTGNAVSIVEPYMKDDFLLVNGDILFTPEAVKAVLNLHQEQKPAASMAAVPVERPENYGVIQLDENRHVKHIIEKPNRGKAPTNLANAGIYVFSTEIFDKIRRTSASARGEVELPDALSLCISEKKPVLAAEIPSADWLEYGKPWDLLEAARWILSRAEHKVFGFVEDGAHLVGPVTVGETARIRSGAYIEGPSFVDAESDVGPNCYVRPFTSIGAGVRIGNACEVKNSIVMDGAHIGHLSYVGDSVVGEKCNFGAGTIIANYRFDAGPVKMMVRDRVVDTGRKKLGAIFGDNVKTGINSLFMPGVKIGNDSWIGPNFVVERDVPPRSVMLLKQTCEKRTM